jgi:hypothetical protein
MEWLDLGLWCLMPLSTLFQLNHGGQFYWWKKPEYLEKTTNLSQITDKLCVVLVQSRHHRHLFKINICSNGVKKSLTPLSHISN